MDNLNRFKLAQSKYLDIAKTEMVIGRKENHWIWFVFPQLKGLGKSYASNYYGLVDAYETMEYYNDKQLRKNLIDCVKILLQFKHLDELTECFGELDTVKIRSCMTLFYMVTKKKIFKKVLDKFFSGLIDDKTVVLLNKGE